MITRTLEIEATPEGTIVEVFEVTNIRNAERRTTRLAKTRNPRRTSMETIKSVPVGEVEVTALTDAEGPFFELGGLFPGVGLGLRPRRARRRRTSPLGSARRESRSRATLPRTKKEVTHQSSTW